MVEKFHAGFLPDFLYHSSELFIRLFQVPWVQRARGETCLASFPQLRLCSHRGCFSPAWPAWGSALRGGRPPPGSPARVLALPVPANSSQAFLWAALCRGHDGVRSRIPGPSPPNPAPPSQPAPAPGPECLLLLRCLFHILPPALKIRTKLHPNKTLSIPGVSLSVLRRLGLLLYGPTGQDKGRWSSARLSDAGRARHRCAHRKGCVVAGRNGPAGEIRPEPCGHAQRAVHCVPRVPPALRPSPPPSASLLATPQPAAICFPVHLLSHHQAHPSGHAPGLLYQGRHRLCQAGAGPDSISQMPTRCQHCKGVSADNASPPQDFISF